MNILFINTNFHEGGAAKVARQLYYGMREKGHNVYFVAGYKSENDTECILINNSILKKMYTIGTGVLQNNQVVSRKSTRKLLLKIIEEKNIDIVHIHNIFENYIGMKDISYIAKKCKVIWTLHDMWAMTGHCAYPLECTMWKNKECSKCIYPRRYPAYYFNDVHYKYSLKKKSFANGDIVYVVPSKWMFSVCKESFLKNEEIKVIYNGINTLKYRPLDKEKLRKKYAIKNNQFIIFFTAAVVTNKIKGIAFLLEALREIEQKDQITIITAGNGKFDNELSGYDLRQMGFVRDEKVMNELYNIADIYVNPSIAESFGCTAAESEATGTPVIAFASGGLSEIVTNDTGWIVDTGDVESLKKAIENAFNEKKNALSNYEVKQKAARQRVEYYFNEREMINQYEVLYENVIQGSDS